MSHSFEGICFPSKGGVKLLAGGNLAWQCSRDFTSDSNVVSQLQGLPILTEFLQKQDEAMSLFLESLLRTEQKLNVPDVFNKEQNSAISRGLIMETVKVDLPSDSLGRAHQKEVQSIEKDIPQLPRFSISDERIEVDLKREGIRFANSDLGIGLPRDKIHRLEMWSDWWANLHEPERRSPLAQILGSVWFQIVTIMVILANTITIALEANYEIENLTQVPHDWFIISEWSFLAFYTVEISLRFYIHRLFCFVNSEWAWNVLDVGIVGISFVALTTNTAGGDNSGVSLGFLRCLRLLRSVKVLRIFRALRVFRELRVMLQCISGSFMALFWCCCLLMLMILLFSIFYVQSLGNYLVHESSSITQREAILENFGSLPRAALTLYKVVTGMVEGEAIFKILLPTGYLNEMVLIAIVGFYQFALINILTGIFAEKALDCAKPDRDMEVMNHRLDNMQRVDALKELCQDLNLSQPGVIKREEFMTCLREPSVKFAFEAEGLPIVDARAFFDLLESVSDADAVDVDTFVASCLRLRGHASTVDLLSLELKVVKVIAEIGTRLEAMIRTSSPQQYEGHLLRNIEAAIERLEAQMGPSHMQSQEFSAPSLQSLRRWV